LREARCEQESIDNQNTVELKTLKYVHNVLPSGRQRAPLRSPTVLPSIVNVLGNPLVFVLIAVVHVEYHDLVAAFDQVVLFRLHLPHVLVGLTFFGTLHGCK
jgi:hypothetical protein